MLIHVNSNLLVYLSHTFISFNIPMKPSRQSRWWTHPSLKVSLCPSCSLFSTLSCLFLFLLLAATNLLSVIIGQSDIIDQFLKFYVDRVIQYVSLFVWLLSLNISIGLAKMLWKNPNELFGALSIMRFIHTILCINSSRFFTAK